MSDDNEAPSDTGPEATPASAERGPEPLAATIADVEATLGGPLPDDYRACVLKGALPPVALTFEEAVKGRDLSRPFPHGLAVAQSLMRPGEYAFIGDEDPPGVIALEVRDGCTTYLVVRGEQFGKVWTGTPYGLCPGYRFVDEHVEQLTFTSWWALEMEVAPTSSARPNLDSAEASETRLLREALQSAEVGGTVSLPEGEYQLEDSMVLRQPVVLYAQGRVVLESPPGRFAFIVDTTEVRFEGIELRVRSGASGAGGAVRVEGGSLVMLGCTCVAVGDGVRSGSGIVLAPRAIVDDTLPSSEGSRASAAISECSFRGLHVGVEAASGSTVALRATNIVACTTGVLVDGDAAIDLQESRVSDCEVGLAAQGRTTGVIASSSLVDNATGARLLDSTQVAARDCLVRASSTCAIEVRGTARSEIARNVVHGGRDGIVVGGRSSPTVWGNLVTRCRTSAIQVVDEAHGVVAENVCAASDLGIHLDSASNPVVLDNVCENNSYFGIQILRGAPVVMRNALARNHQNGIHITEVGSGRITENDSYHHPVAGIAIARRACSDGEEHPEHQRTFVEHNRLFHNARYGIFAADSAVVSLTQNLTSATGDSGIRLTKGVRFEVRGSRSADDRRLGIAVAESASGRISGASIRGPGVAGIAVLGTNPITLMDNRIEGCLRPGVLVLDKLVAPTVFAGSATDAAAVRAVSAADAARLLGDPSVVGALRAEPSEPRVHCFASGVECRGAVRLALLDLDHPSSLRPFTIPMKATLSAGRLEAIEPGAGLILTEALLRALGMPDKGGNVGKTLMGLLDMPFSWAARRSVDARRLGLCVLDDASYLAAVRTVAAGLLKPRHATLREELSMLTLPALMSAVLDPCDEVAADLVDPEDRSAAMRDLVDLRLFQIFLEEQLPLEASRWRFPMLEHAQAARAQHQAGPRFK
ncbi:MAG: right-handed parallel beta-helix repeat-containing protein [Polyangiaceae bacterium]